LASPAKNLDDKIGRAFIRRKTQCVKRDDITHHIFTFHDLGAPRRAIDKLFFI